MRHVAEESACLGAVQDHPQVVVHPRRPEVLVLGTVEPVHLKSRMAWVHLQFHCGQLGGVLLTRLKLCQAVLKRARD